MEPTDETITKLISQLTKLTSQEKLSWAISRAPGSLTGGTDNVISLYFEANYRGQLIALFQRRYQAFSHEFEHIYWTDQLALAFMDEARTPIWEHTDQSPALFNLFAVVRASVADIKGILERLLKDEE